MNSFHDCDNHADCQFHFNITDYVIYGNYGDYGNLKKSSNSCQDGFYLAYNVSHKENLSFSHASIV